MLLQSNAYENSLKYLCAWSGIGIKGDSISKPIRLLKVILSKRQPQINSRYYLTNFDQLSMTPIIK